MIKQLESNLYESFTRVKSDVLKVNNDVVKLSKAFNSIVSDEAKQEKMLEKLADNQEKMLNHITTLTKKVTALEKKSVKTKVVTITKKKSSVSVPRKPKVYVASRNGKTFFPADSVQAKNIKPSNKITFKSKEAFIKRGYKQAKMVMQKVK